MKAGIAISPWTQLGLFLSTWGHFKPLARNSQASSWTISSLRSLLRMVDTIQSLINPVENPSRLWIWSYATHFWMEKLGIRNLYFQIRVTETIYCEFMQKKKKIVGLNKTPQKYPYGDKKWHNWFNNMHQNGFLNYFDDGRHQCKNF